MTMMFDVLLGGQGLILKATLHCGIRIRIRFLAVAVHARVQEIIQIQFVKRMIGHLGFGWQGR